VNGGVRPYAEKQKTAASSADQAASRRDAKIGAVAGQTQRSNAARFLDIIVFACNPCNACNIYKLSLILLGYLPMRICYMAA
jgi:hypothetical protein